MRWIVVVSAGKGMRFGRPTKLLELILGKPVIWHTIRNCYLSSAQKIVLVVPHGHGERFEKIARECGGEKFTVSVLGASTRAGSVIAGLDAVVSHGGSPDDYVAIHDGARPLCSPNLIDAVFDAAEEYGCAIAAIPSVDTVKIVDNGMIVSTLDRKSIWFAQTPQVFRLDLILSALGKTSSEKELTDDSQTVELMGIRPKVVWGEKINIKITTPDDIALAECFIKLRGQG